MPETRLIEDEEDEDEEQRRTLQDRGQTTGTRLKGPWNLFLFRISATDFSAVEQ